MVALLVTALAWAPAARAQQPDEATILHEHFDPDSAHVPGATGPRVAEPTSDARVIHAGVQLPPPSTEATPDAAEPLFRTDGPRSADGAQALGGSNNGPGSTERGRMRLDADTQREGILDYHSVFNPSVVPFKRAGVLDKVVVTRTGDYVLEVADPRLRRVEVVGDEVQPDRDRFWASLVLEATPGRAIPIPSVAPGARILAVETHPEVATEFLVDGADNMFMRLDYEGSVRVNFITDARAEYFAPSAMPAGVRVRDASGYSKPPGLEKGPARDAARQVVRAIGIDRDDAFGSALASLIGYFRDFDPSPLEDAESSGDLYLDVALGRRGVCRHRAFAFVATAQYLGIHARYVYNEAHAFVEVFVPTRGWARVDLGGAAEGLQVHNSDSKILHDPRERDPFPRPQRYLDEFTRVADADPDELAGGFERISGLPRHPSAITDEAPSVVGEVPRGSDGAEGAEGGDGSAVEMIHMEATDPNDAPTPEVPDGAAWSSRPAPTPTTPDDPEQEQPIDVLAGASLVLSGPPESAWRGQEMTLSGTLRSADGSVPLPHRPVQVLLAPVAGTPGQQTALGVGETDAQGHFVIAVELPQTVALGQWDLFAYFPGDPEFAACRSR